MASVKNTENSNFSKLSLLLRLSNKAVRKHFDRIIVHKRRMIQRILDRLKDNKALDQDQMKMFLSYIETGNSTANFDLTFMILILQSIMLSTEYKDIPPAYDVSQDADYARILYYRKKILSENILFTNSVFYNCWFDMSEAIVRLGGSDFSAQCQSLLSENTSVAKLSVADEFQSLQRNQNKTHERPCDLCEFRFEHRPSKVWCIDCDESLCQECVQHHNLNKALKCHSTIPISEFLKYTKQDDTQCMEHKEPFLFHCSTHKTVLCCKCVTYYHRNCSEVITVQQAMSGITYHNFSEMKQRTVLLKRNVEKIKEGVDSNLNSYIEKQQTIKEKLRLAYEEIETFCLNDLSDHQKGSIEYAILIRKCQKELDELMRRLPQPSMLGLTLGGFIKFQELEHQIEEYEIKVQMMLNDKQLSSFDIGFDLDSNSIKRAIITIEKQPLPISLLTLHDNQAQASIKEKLKVIKHFTVEEININAPIRACGILKDDIICLADRIKNRLVFMTTKGLQKEVQLPSRPFDIAIINRKKVAVSFFESKSIQVLDTDIWKWEAFNFSDRNELSGLTYYNDHIVVRASGIGFYMIDLHGNLKSVIPKTEKNTPYVACANDKIYFAKWDTKEVFCCDMTGNTVWTYRDTNLLNPPIRVAAFTNGSLFVTGSYGNNVVTISADGKICQEIITPADDLKQPLGIDFDQGTNRLLVSTAAGDAFLYYVNS